MIYGCYWIAAAGIYLALKLPPFKIIQIFAQCKYPHAFTNCNAGYNFPPLYPRFIIRTRCFRGTAALIEYRIAPGISQAYIFISCFVRRWTDFVFQIWNQELVELGGNSGLMLTGPAFYKVFWTEIYVDDHNSLYFVGICDKIKLNPSTDSTISVN